ncbi:Bifunctional NAD biosynthesis protein NadR [Streptomyces sp. RB5]|uniref:Bifunctional NAD biosynthesis protein NadR n=1 Tax=Streptomyces smaragdinus TaxID=2585196 RepID=A0A7K0CTT5_9ACTN|nr:AAA family ATPase [Streptomyces smaragdinus]MQY16870.1 Bifunctional NAD biosynthesis protein NadR [Streptomyces smaragdinus]
MRYRHGLVLGKFYPPHAGHHHLVRTAAASCERLTVLVCASSVESVPLAERVAWMREVHPDAEVVGAVDDIPVDLNDPDVWAAHVEIFRAAVPGPLDVVFSSEAYGAELGRRMGAASVCVDPDRAAYPVSGTAVRKDPVGCWPYLAAPVRGGLARRVVVLGAESTGTTTLARALAEHYRGRGGVWASTGYVGEYGREFSAGKLAAVRSVRPDATWADVSFASEEFPVIAAEQQAREDRAARAGSPVLFCDTDAFATTIWHERYLGFASDEVARIAARGRQHLWLLTDHTGVDFEDDGLRDGEELRPWMTGRFRDELTRTGRPYRLLTGSRERRLAEAVEAVDALVGEAWLADPLPENR